MAAIYWAIMGLDEVCPPHSSFITTDRERKLLSL
jgi:hypothetical protein